MSRSSHTRRRRWPRFRRRATLKNIPGTIKPDPTSLPPRIHVIAYGPDGVHEQDIETLEEIPPLLTQWPVAWINVDGLGDAEIIRQFGELFGLHPLALEDVVNTHQRPKVEDYDDHLFAVAQMLFPELDRAPEQVSLFIGSTFVLTFQERPGDMFELVRRRIRHNRGRIRTCRSDYLAYALLDSIVDGYFPVLESLSRRIDETELTINRGSGSDMIRDIQSVRNELLLVRRAVWPLRDALGRLVRDPHPVIQPETRAFLRDCYDHTVQLIDVAEIHREICSDLRDYLFAMVSQRANDIMKVLTIIATIFIPLGFIAGVYGMNFDPEVSPWNMPELKWRWGYPFALGVMLAVALGMLVYFWKKRWIGERWFQTNPLPTNGPSSSSPDSLPHGNSPQPGECRQTQENSSGASPPTN